MGAGIISAYTFSSTRLFGDPFIADKENENLTLKKNIRIGIIGAENSHTVGYGKLFNIDKKFPGLEVKYVWGETEEFAKDAMERGGIPNMVKDPNDMLGKIDALIVDHRHAKYHLEPALPFVEKGIPAFIDKPFCYRASEGFQFLKKAREKGTPVTSFSSHAHSDESFDLKDQVSAMDDISHVVMYSPVDVESVYGGVFFYGVHIVQQMMQLFGENIDRVRVTRNNKNATASIAYDNGLLVTLIFMTEYYGWKILLQRKKGIFELTSRIEESDPSRAYRDMVEMFKTGKEPRPYQSILNCVSVLEAIEKSVTSQAWEKVEYLKI